MNDQMGEFKIRTQFLPLLATTSIVASSSSALAHTYQETHSACEDSAVEPQRRDSHGRGSALSTHRVRDALPRALDDEVRDARALAKCNASRHVSTPGVQRCCATSARTPAACTAP